MVQKRVRELRKYLKLTQEDIAKRLDITQGNYTKYENGQLRFSLENIQKISQIWNVSLNWLINGEGEMFNELPGGLAAIQKHAKTMAAFQGIPDPLRQYNDAMAALDPLAAVRKNNEAIAASQLPDVNNEMPSFQRATVPPEPDDFPSDDFIYVPLLDDVKASAGAGYLVESETSSRRMAFRKDWVHHRNITGNTLSALHVTGDSMIPTLLDGDIVLIDYSQNKPISDRIFVVRTGNGVVVKRVGELTETRLQLKSDNSAIPPWSIDLSEGENMLIGRVVWFGRAI
jgi:phage repressor protein C with HTH and peptisase S24 domain